VNPESLVGIFMERSLEMVIGLLGILKAGGAYVPLDPDYPTERLGDILSDSGVSLVLTQESLGDFLPQTGAELLCLDRDWEKIATYSPENPFNLTTPENLAYVIYTSGSTGKPKGVLISHRGLMNLICWHQDAFEITPLDKTTQLARSAFDAAVWELWPCLTAGASLVLVKPEIMQSPPDLRDWLIAQEITVSFLPTPLVEKILSLEWDENIALRIILTGGDKLHHYPSVSMPFKLINNYGPTENSVVTTSGLVPDYEEGNSSSPSIGKPISNTKIYILDRNLQPLPIGVPGELHISSVGLARGYLNRLELTQEKFISNPFNSGILYKTGDLVRYLPDGNIEFLGRIDNQVKLRGLRIELGEIQTVLETHPNVEQTVVIMREDTLYNQRLVAYVIRKDTLLTSQDLRRFLQQKLPVYMIPSAFVMLSDFPLNPNGKIDVHKLPIPDETSLVESPYLAPRNSTETILVSLWQQLLQAGKIGVNDNFFELGGHSLQAMNLMALIYEKMAIEIPLSMIYEKPTVAELSDYIIYAQEMNIQPKERPYVVFNKEQEKAVFLFPPALGFAAAYANLAEYLTNYAIYTFRYISDELMLEKYAELIEDLAQNQDIKLMGHSAGGFLAMLMAQQLESRGRVVSDVILLDTYRGGREAKKADMSEIQEGVDAFLLNPKRQELRGYFLENQKLRNRTYNQVWEYFNFLWNSDLKNVQIQGTIHLIRAEGNYEAQDDWTQATKGERINHYATGIHREMIDPPYLPKNALIINSILNPKQS
jgi:amino acid adenylation domain-containing protein